MTPDQWVLEPHPVRFVYEADVVDRAARDAVLAGAPPYAAELAGRDALARYFKHVTFPLVEFSR